jgi:hypothetical protein
MASHHTPRSNAIRKQDVKKGKMPKKKKTFMRRLSTQDHSRYIGT